MNTYRALTGEVFEIEAATEAEALAKLERAFYSQDTANGVLQFETDTEIELLKRDCTDCRECGGTGQGWHSEDDAGITFGSLKDAQAEAFYLGVAEAVKMAIRYGQTNLAKQILAEAKAPWQSNRDELTPCDTCGVLIATDIHAEELGLCVECSHRYYDHAENEGN